MTGNAIHKLFDKAVDAMLLCDPQGLIVMVNRQFEHLLGYSAREVIGQSVEILVPENLRDRHRQYRVDYAKAPYMRFMGEGFGVMALCKDGRLIEILSSLSPIETAQGSLILNVLRHVPKHPGKLQPYLSTSDTRFREILDHSPLMIWATDKSSKPIFANKVWLDFVGLNTWSELSYRQFIHLIHPEDISLVTQAFQQDNDDPDPVVVEYRLRRFDGCWRWVFDQSMPMFNGQDSFVGFISSVIDITERKEAELSLKKYKAITEMTLDGFWVIDLSGNILETNKAYAEMSGYALDMLPGMNIGHIEALQYQSQIGKIIALGHERFESRLIRMDGQAVEIEVSATYFHDLKQICAFCHDVGYRKWIENTLHDNEEINSNILDSLDEQIVVLDSYGYIVSVNRAWLQFAKEHSLPGQFKSPIGINYFEACEKAIVDGYQEDTAKALAGIRAVLLGLQPGFSMEYACNTHTVQLWFQMHVKRLLGTTSKIIIVHKDITISRQALMSYRIAAIAFESQEAMVITDPNTIILQVNKAFCESSGYSADELVGRKISMLKSGRHDRTFYLEMWEALANKGTWQGEVWDRRKNGEIYSKWLTITAVHDSVGKITHYVGSHTDMSERKAAENEIRRLAFYDPLTQLPNRRLLRERMKHGIEVMRREGKKLAVLMLDLDRFKQVNDCFGHLQGDELLQMVAQRLQGRLREMDTAARLGGDEFVVMLEGIAHADDAARVAEALVGDLAQPFILGQYDEVRIGTSIGISLYPEHGEDPDTLLGHADAALYQSKNEGRGRFAYFSENLTLAARKRMALEKQMRRAIEGHEFTLQYQPQIALDTGMITGAEALLRWYGPEGIAIPPEQFIPIAEETGLIIMIGEWVLREACRQGREWLDAGLPPLRLAVNVSSLQFQRSDIRALLANILAETGFPPQYLELEITETGLLDPQGKVMEVLDHLREQGISLAIDDFGTGYSSLVYLKRVPVDTLKIDRGFIEEIPGRHSDKEIASTIVAIGHALGFKVLAEGVETQEQLTFLQSIGCDGYQGYYTSPAVTATEFAELLRQQLASRLD